MAKTAAKKPKSEPEEKPDKRPDLPPDQLTPNGLAVRILVDAQYGGEASRLFSAMQDEQERLETAAATLQEQIEKVPAAEQAAAREAANTAAQELKAFKIPKDARPVLSWYQGYTVPDKNFVRTLSTLGGVSDQRAMLGLPMIFINGVWFTDPTDDTYRRIMATVIAAGIPLPDPPRPTQSSTSPESRSDVGTYMAELLDDEDDSSGDDRATR